MIHTHGAYFDKQRLSENIDLKRALEPSIGDFNEIMRTHLNSYVVTPDGCLYLLEYDKTLNKIIPYIFEPLYPSDMKCPHRRNNFDYTNYPDNFYYSESEYKRMHKK